MISKANTKNLYKIVEIHKEVLNNTLTSKTGKPFILSLYKLLLKNRPRSEVLIYKDTRKVLGFIGLTRDRLGLNAVVSSELGFRQKIDLAIFLLLHPVLIGKLYDKLALDRFLAKNYKEGFPSILTLGVSPGAQGGGIGRKLIGKADKFFEEAGFLKYFVDTEESNNGALKFYNKLGFRRVATVARNVILEKKI